MTIQESTICGLIQSFPVLIILAQNNNKCLKTPFIYKPPTPTQPPEYYHALDALFQSIYGHDQSGHSYQGGHGYGDYYGNAGNTYYQTNPCSYGMYGKKYHDGSQKCYQYFYPTQGYQSPVYNNYPNYGYKKANLYNIASNQSYAYANYAADQVYNGNTKYKVVVKRTRIGGRKKSERLKGFFPRRDDRQSPLNLASNFRNQLHNTINGFFNVGGRQRPAIISDQDREMADRPYNPNQDNFNRPVVFPTTNPDERPVDTNPGAETPNQYNPDRQDQYPTYNQPNYDTNQEYTDRPVSFPVQPSNPGSDYNTGSINNNQGGYQDNVQTTQEVQESSNSFSPNAPSDVGNDYNGFTTKGPGLEGTTEGNKYENRFGEDSGSLPTLPNTPNFDSRNVNFGPSGIFAETCQTVENEIGSCINLNQCEPYLKLLKEYRTNPSVVKLLRSAQCGFDGNDPKVCCPRPGLPTSAPQTTTTTTTTTAAPTTTKAPSLVVEPSGKSIGTEDYVPAFPDPPVCGFSNASLSRVVGGVDAKLGDFPWMALLGYRKRTNPVQWKCGGSLVTQKHVITAAHCVHNKENELFVVRLGELDLAKEDDGAAPVDILIKHMIKHEQYSPTAYTNDIAVLVLQKEVEYTDLIRPICMPQTAELRAINFEDYTPLVAGWGNIEQRGPAATHLQVVQLPVVSNDFCKQAYRNYTQQKIDERVLCAGYKKGGKDSCSGDSGGPLMQPIWNKKTFKTYIFQIGVVSFGKGCAQAGFPGVYSRVTHFLPWLEQKVIGHTK